MKELKPIKCFTREGNITFYGTDKEVLVPENLKVKKNDFRGVWFSTVENIDIPGFESKEEGMKYLDGVIDTCVEYNLNAVIFQIRPTNDALYESEINPWSSFLSKERKEDVNPGFDVLGYFIEKAKKHNIEVHAWMNPYRVTNRDLSKMGLTKLEYLNKLSERNYARLHPELVLETKEHHLILDPASKEVQQYLVDTVMEVANKYDVKAFHIDDYFYPYDPINDPDEEEKRMKITPYLDLAEFRRYNVNEMIRKIHEALKEVKDENGNYKKVEFGISPFAVYRTNSKYFENGEGGWYRGSNNAPFSFQCYESLYSDIYLWMKEGWIDYVTPQDYFALDNCKLTEDGKYVEIVKYADVVEWWNEISKETKTKLYIGMAIYRVTDEPGVWNNPEELIDQLKVNSMYDNVSGSIMFTFKNFKKTDAKVLSEVQEKLKKVWK